MTKSKFILYIEFLVILLSALSINAQPTGEKVKDRFYNGNDSFRRFIQESINPINEGNSGETLTGTEIAGLTIDSSGRIISTFILNSIGEEFDEQITKLFYATAGYWKKDSTQPRANIVIPITVLYNNNRFEVSWDKKPSYMLDELYITVSSNDNIITDEELTSAVTDYLDNKKYNEALDKINELIKRNPFKREHYIQRAQINRALGNNDLACTDIKRIIYMLKQNAPDEYQHYCK